MIKHTAIPWKLIEIMGSSSIHAGNIEILNYYSPIKISIANARFIVTAVNCHKLLLKTLKTIANYSACQCYKSHGDNKTCCVSVADEVIAKAEEITNEQDN